MDESTLSIMEVREDSMVSPVGDSEPTLRSAHFLKPLAKSLDGAVSEILSSSMNMPLPPVFEPKEWPLVIHFSWWRHTNRKWVEWMHTLQLRYESAWKKVGIFEAIMSTKCSITKDQNLCIGVAEKWCPETNTFLFPWGEATITLEDVMVLGAYPLVGDPVFTTLQSQEMREVENKLIRARQEPRRRKNGNASLSAWMDLFVNSGSEIEHEAFLATWLSMVGFSHNGYVSKFVFPIAVHLARGNTLALGPAVLAGIYKDLTFLKKTIVGLTEKLVLGDKLEEETLHSPFYLVQIWVWERFKNLQPQPRWINHEDPMLFRWHKVQALKIDNVRLALDSAMEHFRWRPYVQYAGKFKVFYPENETLVPFETNLNKEVVSLVTCLRVSVLVGIQSTIKQYLPHRVAMQFGMDQDVPACVPRLYGTKDIAWKNYCRPISDKNLYFPARLYEGDVTTRYAKWWKKSVLMSHQDFAKNIVRRKRSLRPPCHGPHASKANINGNDADVPACVPRLYGTKDIAWKNYCRPISDKNLYFPARLFEGEFTTRYAKWWKQSVLMSHQDFAKNIVRRKRSLRPPCHGPHASKANINGNDADVPPGFAPKLGSTAYFGNFGNDDSNAKKGNSDSDVPSGFLHKRLKIVPSGSSVQDDLKDNENTDADVLTRFKNLFIQSSAASTVDYDNVKRPSSLTKPVAKDTVEPLTGDLEEDFEDANGSKESRLSSERVSVPSSQVESYSFAPGIKVMDLEQRMDRLQKMIKKLKAAKFGHC